MALAVIYLFEDPQQSQSFLRAPDQVSAAVEELIRFSQIVSDGAQVPRVAPSRTSNTQAAASAKVTG